MSKHLVVLLVSLTAGSDQCSPISNMSKSTSPEDDESSSISHSFVPSRREFILMNTLMHRNYDTSVLMIGCNRKVKEIHNHRMNLLFYEMHDLVSRKWKPKKVTRFQFMEVDEDMYVSESLRKYKSYFNPKVYNMTNLPFLFFQLTSNVPYTNQKMRIQEVLLIFDEHTVYLTYNAETIEDIIYLVKQGKVDDRDGNITKYRWIHCWM